MPANPGIQKMSWVTPRGCSDLGSLSGGFGFIVTRLLDYLWLRYIPTLRPLPQKVNPKGAAAAEAASQLSRLCRLLTAVPWCVSLHS